jgi:hypothetical protein
MSAWVCAMNRKPWLQSREFEALLDRRADIAVKVSLLMDRDQDLNQISALRRELIDVEAQIAAFRKAQ